MADRNGFNPSSPPPSGESTGPGSKPTGHSVKAKRTRPPLVVTGPSSTSSPARSNEARPFNFGGSGNVISLSEYRRRCQETKEFQTHSKTNIPDFQLRPDVLLYKDTFNSSHEMPQQHRLPATANQAIAAVQLSTHSLGAITHTRDSQKSSVSSDSGYSSDPSSQSSPSKDSKKSTVPRTSMSSLGVPTRPLPIIREARFEPSPHPRDTQIPLSLSQTPKVPGNILKAERLEGVTGDFHHLSIDSDNRRHQPDLGSSVRGSDCLRKWPGDKYMGFPVVPQEPHPERPQRHIPDAKASSQKDAFKSNLAKRFERNVSVQTSPSEYERQRRRKQSYTNIPPPASSIPVYYNTMGYTPSTAPMQLGTKVDHLSIDDLRTRRYGGDNIVIVAGARKKKTSSLNEPKLQYKELRTQKAEPNVSYKPSATCDKDKPAHLDTTSTSSSANDTDCSLSASSEDTQSESDSLWLVPECSEESGILEADHPLFQIKDLALRKVLEGYRAWQECPAGPGNSATHGSSSHTSQDNQGSGSAKKRQRKPTSDETPDEGDADSGAQKTASKRRKTTEKKLTFACPFSKRDPMKHRDCYKYMLNRIRDVKQHLVRCHRVPLYCPRCMDTFPGEEERDSHIRDVDCPKRAFVKLDGVTDSQRSLLAKKVPSNISKEDQWFGVFDILFPDHPRPASPYIDNDLLQDITLYQDYLTSHGPRILSDILTAHGVVTWNLPNEERDMAAFQRSIFEEGLRIIFQQWANQNGISLTESISQSGTDSSTSMGQLTPTSGDESVLIPTEAFGEQDLRALVAIEKPPVQDAATSSNDTNRPEDLDLAYPDASLGDYKGSWEEDMSTAQLTTLTAEEEDVLVSMMEDKESEQPLSSWAWQLFQ